MKYTQWNTAPARPEAAQALAARGVSPLAALVLCARELDGAERLAPFLSSGPDALHDPLLLPDMAAAADRVNRAIHRGETVAVYGDYDVDGITSTCLLTHYLRARGCRVLHYIPDRIEEGYGLNREAISSLHTAGATLLVTVDCGITALDEAEHAAALGLDLVITDHHECGDRLPSALAVVNPCRADSAYPFPHLAGVGVALKLALALGGPEQHAALLEEYADLAAIGTVADVMPLTGENRALVRLGLAAMTRRCRPGLAALLREAGAQDKPLTATSIGFLLSPRLNAAGRMGCAALAADLLLADGEAEAAGLAARLCELNRARQAVEGEIFEACSALLEGDASPRRALVLAGEGWHQGVVGIVASRLAEKYACPAFVISLQNGLGKGSCRSFGGFNLYEALGRCADLLEAYGGHAPAAGFTIRAENISAFRARLDALVAEHTGGAPMVSVLEVDAALPDLGLLTQPQVEALAALEPHGAGNPRPVFTLSDMTVALAADVGGGRHLRLRLGRGGRTLDGIFFSATAAQHGVSPGDRVDVAFYPQINEFRGVRSVQLLVTDLRPAAAGREGDRALYEKLLRGENLSSGQARSLLPSRAEFAGVWRYLRANAPGGLLETGEGRLSRSVACTYGLQEAPCRTLVCLRVLADCDLIVLEEQDGRLSIRLGQPAAKVDLEQSPVLRRLRALAE